MRKQGCVVLLYTSVMIYKIRRNSACFNLNYGDMI